MKIIIMLFVQRVRHEILIAQEGFVAIVASPVN